MYTNKPCAICGNENSKIREFFINEIGECDAFCDEHYIEVLEISLDGSHGKTDGKRGGGMLSRYSYNPKRKEIIIQMQEHKRIRRFR
jgi:hypothetical protein